jgi:hypothetical protein
MDTATIPVVTGIVFLVLEALKAATNSNEVFKKIIPILAGVLGITLGVLTYYFAPNMIAADNVVQAILLGLASGLAATGTHQIFKQITKG